MIGGQVPPNHTTGGPSPPSLKIYIYMWNTYMTYFLLDARV